MRLLMHPGGIAACVFVWICWWVVKLVTDVLLFNLLLADVPTDRELDDVEHADVQLPLTYSGLVLKTVFECITWLGLLSHLGAVFTDPGSTKTAPVHYEDGPPLSLGEQLHRVHEPEILLPVPFVHRFLFASPDLKTLFIEHWTTRYPRWLAVLMLGACLLIDIVFLLITLDFLSEQWEALETNATLVETYRNTHGKKSTLWEHAVAVFGSQWWLWWLPVPPNIVPNWTDPELKVEKRRTAPHQHALHTSDLEVKEDRRRIASEKYAVDSSSTTVANSVR
ncbi:hypothetical protein Esti_003405 [Eimeria stiedai]